MVELSNEKHKAFADEYLITLNATESYASVYGCSYNTARTNGARLLANANIKKYIDERLEAKEESRIASQDEILQILTDIARGITEEEVVQFSQLGEELRTIRKPTIKDRMKASELLGKRYRMWTDKLEIKEDSSIQIEIVNAGEEDD